MTLRNRGYLVEAYYDDGIGTFGGKAYKWPTLRGGEWEDSLPVGSIDKFGDCTKVEYSSFNDGAYVIVMLDADDWARSSGARPVKYQIRAIGQEKTGTLRSPELDQIEKLGAFAKKWATQEMRKRVAAMPSVPGWRKYGKSDVEYEKQYYGEAFVSVSFSEVDTASKKDPGDVYMFFSAESDYEGHRGKKQKEMSWTGPGDVKRVLAQADKFGLWAYKKYFGMSPEEDKKSVEKAAADQRAMRQQSRN